MRLLEVEVTSLAASHVRQMIPAEEADRHKGVPNARGPSGPELQALGNAGEASLDDTEKDKLTHLLTQHREVFATK